MFAARYYCCCVCRGVRGDDEGEWRKEEEAKRKGKEREERRDNGGEAEKAAERDAEHVALRKRGRRVSE